MVFHLDEVSSRADSSQQRVVTFRSGGQLVSLIRISSLETIA
jgi:hypothetical protein